MTHGKSVLPPPTIMTSQLWDELPVADDHHRHYHHCCHIRELRWRHKQSQSQRAKSHSPSRRSPKIKHTNGRLDEDPIAARAPGSDNAVKHQRTLTRHRPAAVIPTHGEERGMSESAIPQRAGVIRRSVTEAPQASTQHMECRVTLDPSTSPARRLMVCFRDEALRERSAEITRRMIVIARSPTAGDTSAATACVSRNQQKIALKVLKYRNLLARASEINDARLEDPTFDVLEGLGVRWSKS